MKKDNKVLVGMSGGVDSSVSALLLKKAGYEVIGVTMKLWETEDTDKVSSTILDAKNVCEQIGIEHRVLDCGKEFKEHVINNFICSYACAKTPNPCVECNKYLKFEALYKLAEKIGCNYIATGHYAHVEYSEKYKQYVLKKSEADKKDQTYFLYDINKKILPHILFPLEKYKEKDEIRNIAQKNGLKVAYKKDSQEICFVPDNDYIKFLKDNMKSENIKNGNICLTDGTIMGKHDGLLNYTVGQRKGLGIAYKEPLYVIKLDRENNQVIIGTQDQLYADTLYANELNFLLDINLSKPLRVKAKIRYRAKEADATIYMQENGTIKVVFEERQRAITPGQSVVFYIDDGIVLGGGKII